MDVFTDHEDRHLRKRTRQAERGAEGEVTVAALLAELPDSYLVVHDLSRVGGDIDHVVVGPTGIFVIETKAHRGQVTAEGEQVLVNGRPPEKDFIAQCWGHAYWLRDQLREGGGIEATVTPILVFAQAFVRTRPVKGVRVINIKYLQETILGGQPVDLPIDQISAFLERIARKAGK